LDFVATGRTVRGLWVLAAACVLIAAFACVAGGSRPPRWAGTPGPGPAFVQVRDSAGRTTVVALPPGFLAMLDGRSFAPGPGARPIAGWMDGETLVALGIPVPINQVVASDLAAIPGVSRRTAAAIEAARSSDGPFASWDDLDAVKGVGEKTLAVLQAMGRL
jgi:hypothetical protein